MDVTPLIPQGRQIIQSYAGGGFRISGSHYPGAVIVTPERTMGWDMPKAAEALAPPDFTAVIENSEDVDVWLLGTGAKMEFVALALKQALKAQGILIEPMDTGAACRTYNVLMAEGRRVMAVLLPV